MAARPLGRRLTGLVTHSGRRSWMERCHADFLRYLESMASVLSIVLVGDPELVALLMARALCTTGDP